MLLSAAFRHGPSPMAARGLNRGRAGPAFKHKPVPRVFTRRARGLQHTCRATSEATELLSAGLKKYVAGDRMGALTLFEESLKKSPNKEDRLAALWNSTCVHAYFGDAEVAQISLREAVALGLDFESALQQSDPRYVKLQASAQILIQLRRFSQAAAKAAAAAAAAAEAQAQAPSAKQRPPSGYKTPIMQQDVSELTQTDMEGLDTSMMGVVRRVALLLVVLILLGVGLFYVGLELTFADQ